MSENLNEFEILQQVNELENKADRILKAKRKSLARRPIVIEFSGTPKSGKSSCISSLDIFLRRNNFKTKVLTERASVCPISNKFDPLFNIWNACAGVNQLSEIVSNRPRDYDVIIMDRGFFDSLCWLEWQKINGFLGEEDFSRFISFFTAPRFRMMIDLILHFDAYPKTSMEREYRNLLTRKEGSVMRQKVLEGYRCAANEAINKYSSQFRQFESIATDDLDQNAVGAKVTDTVLNKLRDVARERICFVERSSLQHTFGSHDTRKYSEIKSFLNKNIQFADRDELENDRKRVQLIPIAFLKDKGNTSFVVARKGKQATSEFSPEMGKILLYFGGHVREEDKTLFEEKEAIGVLKQCIYREVKEELGVDIKLSDEEPVCIWIRDGSRSDLHMAVAFIVERDLNYTKFSIDFREFVRASKEKYGTGSIIDSTGIRVEFDKLDTWSQIILKSTYFKERIWGSQKSLFD